MKDGRIGIGLVGVGLISSTHRLALEHLQDCCLVGCYNRNPQKAKAWADEYGYNFYEDYQDMLSDPEIDVVSIITPPGCHLEYAIPAMKAGKHVLVEKPMEIHADRVREMIKVAKENNVILSGVFQSRFNDVSALTREAVRKGRFGKISICDAQVKWFRDQAYYDSGAWRGTWAIDGGGVLMQQGIHAVDLLLYVMGEDPSEVYSYAETVSHDIEVEDTSVAVLRFPSGSLGVIEGSTSAWPGSPRRIEICGSTGHVVIEDDSLAVWSFQDETEEDEIIRKKYRAMSSGGSANTAAVSDYTGHARQYMDMVKAIRSGCESSIPGEEAIRSIHVIEAIYQSSRDGIPVRLTKDDKERT